MGKKGLQGVGEVPARVDLQSARIELGDLQSPSRSSQVTNLPEQNISFQVICADATGHAPFQSASVGQWPSDYASLQSEQRKAPNGRWGFILFYFVPVRNK